MESRVEIENLLNEAYGLPYGHSRVTVLERAIRIADQHQMTDLAFEARQALVDSASLSGHWELVPIHFPWLLATCDKYPDQFDEIHVVFEYLSATQSLAFFSRVQKKHIVTAQDDLEQRFRKFGYDLQEVRRIKFLNAIEMGDFEVGAEILEEMSKYHFIPRGTASSGEYAHRLYCRGWFEILRGNEEDGLRDLANVYDHPAPDSIIHGFAISISLPVLLMRDRTERLQNLAVRCEKEVRGRPEMIEPFTEYMQFLSRSENVDRVLERFHEYGTYGEDVRNELDRLGYLQTARFCIKLAIDCDRFDEIRWPQKLPTQFRTQETALNYFEERARELATAFDSRNENSFYTDRLDASLNWETNPFPIEISE